MLGLLRRILGLRRSADPVGEARRVEPIFVIGANRSGTSLLAHLLSKHLEVEGLFLSDSVGDTDASGHTKGYSESGFIWRGLHQEAVAGVSRFPLFGLPDALSGVYRSCTRSATEAARLCHAVLRARKTEKAPLIKDNLNVLRIGLIKELFPKARFVFIIREPDSYVRSNRHKWADAIARNARAVSEVGLHWALVNTVAAYDLERFAPGDYISVDFGDLMGEKCGNVLADVVGFLKLSPHALDTSAIQPGRQYVAVQGEDSVGKSEVALFFEGLKALSRFEQDLIEEER